MRRSDLAYARKDRIARAVTDTAKSPSSDIICKPWSKVKEGKGRPEDDEDDEKVQTDVLVIMTPVCRCRGNGALSCVRRQLNSTRDVVDESRGALLSDNAKDVWL